MKRRTIAALALAGVLAVGGGMAIAQQGGPGAGGGPGMGRGPMMGMWQPPSPEVMQRMLDGRIAGAKAALRLTPEQEKLWPAVEQAVREMAAKRIRTGEEMRTRMKEMREQNRRPDMIEMLERGSQRSAERSGDLKKMVDALKPLHATLSDEQKQVLGMALRPMRMGGPGGHGGHGRWMHRG